MFYMRSQAQYFMETIVKVLITQNAILLCWHLCMHPSTPLASYMEKVFKDYGKALTITNGVQVIGIIATIICWLWIE